MLIFADVKILKLKFSQDLKLEFGQYYEDEIWSNFVFELVI